MKWYLGWGLSDQVLQSRSVGRKVGVCCYLGWCHSVCGLDFPILQLGKRSSGRVWCHRFIRLPAAMCTGSGDVGTRIDSELLINTMSKTTLPDYARSIPSIGLHRPELLRSPVSLPPGFGLCRFPDTEPPPAAFVRRCIACVRQHLTNTRANPRGDATLPGRQTTPEQP